MEATVKSEFVISYNEGTSNLQISSILCDDMKISTILLAMLTSLQPIAKKTGTEITHNQRNTQQQYGNSSRGKLWVVHFKYYIQFEMTLLNLHIQFNYYFAYICISRLIYQCKYIHYCFLTPTSIPLATCRAFRRWGNWFTMTWYFKLLKLLIQLLTRQYSQTRQCSI